MNTITKFFKNLLTNLKQEIIMEQPEFKTETQSNNLLKYDIVLIEKPTNQLAEILYEMLVVGKITRKSAMMFGVLNLTSRIAVLRNHYNIDVVCEETPTKNKFGRPVSYGIWHVSNKDYAYDRYVNKINK
jgi:hypothetical protein